MKTVKKINDCLLKVIEIMCVVMLAVIAVVILIQVGARLFNIGLLWPEEVSRLSFVTLTFWGSIVCIAKGKHILIDMFILKLPYKLRQVWSIVINIAVAIDAYLIANGFTAMMEKAGGVHFDQIKWFMYNYEYAIERAACILMIVECVMNIIFIVMGLCKREGKEA